jgi:hypothetical protein
MANLLELGAGYLFGAAYCISNLYINEFLLECMSKGKEHDQVKRQIIHGNTWWSALLKRICFGLVFGLPLYSAAYFEVKGYGMQCKDFCIQCWRRLNRQRWKRQNPYYRRHKAVATLLLCIKQRYPRVPKDIRKLLGTYIKYDLTTGWTDENTGQVWKYDSYSWICGEHKYHCACHHCLGPLNVEVEFCRYHGCALTGFIWLIDASKTCSKRYMF